MEVYRQQLEQAVGTGGKLSRSVKLGVDELLRDAIGESISEASCPYIRISCDTESALIPSVGGAINTTVNLRIFFVMCFGKPGGLVTLVDFVSLREQYVAWNMEYLKEQQVGPNSSIGFVPAQWQDDAGKRFWWLTGDQQAQINHQTPFDVFGITKTIPASSGFTVSRLDYKVTVRNNATWNGIMWPAGNLTQVFAEPPTESPDGTRVTFTTGKNIQPDANGVPGITISWNGVEQPRSAFSYDLMGHTFTFLLPDGLQPPQVNDLIQATYLTISPNF